MKATTHKKVANSITFNDIYDMLNYCCITDKNSKDDDNKHQNNKNVNDNGNRNSNNNSNH